MNYPFKNAVLDFVKASPPSRPWARSCPSASTTPPPAINTALNFFSTHDTERASP